MPITYPSGPATLGGPAVPIPKFQNFLNTGTMLAASGAAVSDIGFPLFFQAGEGEGARGGNVDFLGGTGTFGGDVVMMGGLGTGGTGGIVSMVGGTGAPVGGSIELEAGPGAATGGSVNLIAAPGTGGTAGGLVTITFDTTAADPGELQINNDPSLICITLAWKAGDALNGRTIFTTTRAMMITAIIARIDAVNGVAATAAPYAASSGTAFSAGTALTTDSINLATGAGANQTLALVTTPATVTLAPGDSLGLVETGVLGTSAGCVTIWGTPQ